MNNIFKDYNAFYEFVVLEAGVSVQLPKKQRRGRYRCDGDPKDAYLYVRWCSGGMEGGNCWGGEANRPVEAEREPEFEDLDNLLEQLCPDISHLVYKALYKECVEIVDGESFREYYGNYHTYLEKRVGLVKLYNFLLGKGLIKNE